MGSPFPGYWIDEAIGSSWNMTVVVAKNRWRAEERRPHV